MKRFVCLLLTVLLIMVSLASCEPEVAPVTKNLLRLSDFVGVWTNTEESVYYRFTPTSLWFRYNRNGEVDGRGDLVFDGESFCLTDRVGSSITLFAVDKSEFKDRNSVSFFRTDSVSSLISAEGYEAYFNEWYEDGNLMGNVISVQDPETWIYRTQDGNIIAEGNFYAYEGDEENLYLYEKDSGDFFAYLSQFEDGVLFHRNKENGKIRTISFETKENSSKKSFYFKDKQLEINYEFEDGSRLLRNGGAAYNDAHDYKKMPVTCRIEKTDDKLLENNLREVTVSVIYEFRESDLPKLSGNTIYNSVRFSQYDYYTGQLFYMDDSTGTQFLTQTWTTERDGKSYSIQCNFSSQWEYPKGEEVVVRFCGVYRLTMPEDYDGFVICLRPVFNSYSSQVSASITPQEGTLALEDLGEDSEQCIFCRIERNWEGKVS